MHANTHDRPKTQLDNPPGRAAGDGAENRPPVCRAVYRAMCRGGVPALRHTGHSQAATAQPVGGEPEPAGNKSIET